MKNISKTYDKHMETETITITETKDITKTKKIFIPPTLEEIKVYCLERKNNVDPKKFYDYFEVSNWVDSKGKKVKNWKQRVISWEQYAKPKETKKNYGDWKPSEDYAR